jgi:hypothetical protein
VIIINGFAVYPWMFYPFATALAGFAGGVVTAMFRASTAQPTGGGAPSAPGAAGAAGAAGTKDAKDIGGHQRRASPTYLQKFRKRGRAAPTS